jgi:hypothetical protein
MSFCVIVVAGTLQVQLRLCCSAPTKKCSVRVCAHHATQVMRCEGNKVHCISRFRHPQHRCYAHMLFIGQCARWARLVPYLSRKRLSPYISFANVQCSQRFVPILIMEQQRHHEPTKPTPNTQCFTHPPAQRTRRTWQSRIVHRPRCFAEAGVPPGQRRPAAVREG